MSPTIKEPTLVTGHASESGASQPAAASPRPAESPRSQPVCIEVPVTIHGSRSPEPLAGGTEQQEPFQEETRTVLVFSQGAVVRLSSSVVQGQLLFLTNQQSKREVLCRVVKSRSFPNVKGYVEVEFTQTTTGFWGIRFPSDPLTPVEHAEPASAPAGKAAPASAPPAAVSVETKQAETRPAGSRPILPVSLPAATNLPAASSAEEFADLCGDSFAPVAAKSPATASPPAPKAETRVEGKPPATVAPEISAPISVKDHAPLAISSAVQESRVMAPASPKPRVPVVEKPIAPSVAHPTSEPTISLESPRSPTLAPLRTPAPRRTEEPAGSPTVKQPEVRKSSPATETFTRVEISPGRDSISPLLSGTLLQDEAEGEVTQGETERPARRTWMLVAASVLVVTGISAGGYFYWRHAVTSKPAAAFSRTVADAAPAAPQMPAVSSPEVSAPAPVTSSPVGSSVEASTTSSAPAPSSSSSSQPKSLPAAAVKTVKEKPVETAAKRAALPNFKLQTSKPTQPVAARSDEIAAPSVDAGVPSAQGGTLGGILSAVGKGNPQPAPPAPNETPSSSVRPARLVSSVPPTYPSLAKTKNVEGDVMIDALIGTDGRVSTMKVASGPVLLQQAAMDALRRWKYEPALLNGQPVSVHLSVVIKFRLSR